MITQAASSQWQEIAGTHTYINGTDASPRLLVTYKFNILDSPRALATSTITWVRS